VTTERDVRHEALSAAAALSGLLTAVTTRPHRDGLDPGPSWRSETRTGGLILRSDLELVDRTADRGVLTLHVCAHPHHGDPSPVYGFDAVVGRDSATVFLDLSPTVPDHPSVAAFGRAAAALSHLGRPVDLPGWARDIFSPGILALRGLDASGLARVCDLAVSALATWVVDLSGPSTPADPRVVEAHRRYALRQRENERTTRSLVALGYDADYVDRFVTTRLFPTPEAMAAG